MSSTGDRTFTITLTGDELLLTRYALAYQYSSLKDLAGQYPKNSVARVQHTHSSTLFHELQLKFEKTFTEG